MKRFSFIILVGMCFLLIGCKKNAKGENIKNNESPEEASNVITWVYLFYPGISAENQREINRILQEKGIDYQIRFVLPLDGEGCPLTGGEYAEWVESYEKNGALDILTSGVWPAGVSTELEFIRKQMVPLNAYFETSDGKILKEFFTEEEWKACSLEGNSFVIPQPVIGGSDNYGVDAGVYVSVKEEYATYFNTFDGTYDSLMKSYNAIGDKNLRIVFPYLPSAREVLGLLGYSILENSLPFSEEEKKVVDITKTDEMKNLLQNMYTDMKSKTLVIQSWELEIPKEQVLAYIYTNKKMPRAGFKDYLIAPGINELNLRGKYGISVNSKRKEHAFQILSICLTDPDILCLLYPGVDRELILNRKELLSCESGELFGISFSFDEKQASMIRSFSNEYSSLVNSLQRSKTNADDGYYYELNPTFDIDLEWKKFAESINSYTYLCDSANQQIQEWLQK